MLTLNIEDDAIKITYLKNKSVVKALALPLAAGIVHNGVIVEKDKVSAMIVQLLADNVINEKEVHACVSGMNSIYRVVYLPKMESGLLDEAAKLEMQRVIPVPLDTLYTSWYPIHVSNLETALCLIGIPRENIDSLQDVVKMSNLSLKYVELRPLSVARVIDDPTAITLNVRDSVFDLTVTYDGIPEIIRSAAFNDIQMSDADKVAQIKEEIDRTVSYFNAGHKTTPLTDTTACFISGGLIENLSHAIGGYSVSKLPQPLNYPEGCNSNDFAANTGLAIRLVGKQRQFMKVQVNAIAPVAAQSRKLSGKMLITAAVVCVLILVATFIYGKIVAQMNENSRLIADSKLKQVVELQKQVRDTAESEKKEIETYKAQLTGLKDPLDYLSGQRQEINYNTGKALSYLPGVVNLSSIQIDTASIQIEGTAPDEVAVYDYARELQQSGAFNMVLISSIQNVDYNEYIFKISLRPAN